MWESGVNIQNISNNNVIYDQCTYFNIHSISFLEFKQLLKSSLTKNFDEHNWLQLFYVTGNSVIINVK